MIVFKVLKFEQQNGVLCVSISSNNIPDLAPPNADLRSVLIVDWSYPEFINLLLHLRQVATRESAAYSTIDGSKWDIVNVHVEWREITWRINRIRYCSSTGAITLELTQVLLHWS